MSSQSETLWKALLLTCLLLNYVMGYGAIRQVAISQMDRFHTDGVYFVARPTTSTGIWAEYTVRVIFFPCLWVDQRLAGLPLGKSPLTALF